MPVGLAPEAIGSYVDTARCQSRIEVWTAVRLRLRTPTGR